MHLPDGIIGFNEAMIYLIITLIVIAIFSYTFKKNGNKNMVLIAMFTAFTIVISSLSIPSPLGFPIHFFIIPLIAIVLGPYIASIVSFLSLLVQALFFGIGGLVAIGANFIVMGLVLSFATFCAYNILKIINEKMAILASTLIGIIFATFGQVLILLISGAMNFNSLLATLIPFYIFIGIIEGFANVIIISFIKRFKPEIFDNTNV